MQQIVESIAVQLGLDASQYSKGVDDVKKKGKELNSTVKEADANFAGMAKAISGAVKSLSGLFAAFSAATGLDKLVNDVAKANDELNFLNKQLGMSTQSIKAWQNVAAASGGSAQGMTSSMKSLNKQMSDFVTRGDTTLLPYMNALGVSMVDANGKLRKTDAVMLDLADSFSKMDKQQAYSLGQSMGLDEGTINTLIQGKDAMKEMIAYQKTMYQSTEKDLAASRELQKNKALINAQWDSMKTMMANSIIPLFVKLSGIVLKFFEFMQKHRRTVTIIFQTIAITLTAAVIPALYSALTAALAFIAPFAPFILVVSALAAAFVLLYDDYKTWAEGGKSLFDWGAFSKYIDSSKLSVDGLTSAFSNMAKELASGAIPTLKEYWAILKKLFSGDFKEAGKEAWGMTKEAGRKVGGAIDRVTGHEVGTLAGTSIFNKGGNMSQSYSSKAFTAAKAASIQRVAKNIGVNPNDLAAVISFETGGTFNPAAKNPKSSATGLIQFMSGSGGTKGQYYGMSRNKFASLSFDQQMNYVEKYFKDRGFKQGQNRNVGDVYGAVTGYGYKRGSGEYALNKVWDSNGNGIIEKGEMVKNPSFRKHQRDYFGSPTNKHSLAEYANRAQVPDIQSTFRPNHVQASGNNVSKSVSVNTGDIKVYTAANNVTGTTTDALKAVDNYANQLGAVMT